MIEPDLKFYEIQPYVEVTAVRKNPIMKCFTNPTAVMCQYGPPYRAAVATSSGGALVAMANDIAGYFMRESHGNVRDALKMISDGYEHSIRGAMGRINRYSKKQKYVLAAPSNEMQYIRDTLWNGVEDGEGFAILNKTIRHLIARWKVTELPWNQISLEMMNLLGPTSLFAAKEFCKEIINHYNEMRNEIDTMEESYPIGLFETVEMEEENDE